VQGRGMRNEGRRGVGRPGPAGGGRAVGRGRGQGGAGLDDEAEDGGEDVVHPLLLSRGLHVQQPHFSAKAFAAVRCPGTSGPSAFEPTTTTTAAAAAYGLVLGGRGSPARSDRKFAMDSSWAGISWRNVDPVRSTTTTQAAAKRKLLSSLGPWRPGFRPSDVR